MNLAQRGALLASIMLSVGGCSANEHDDLVDAGRAGSEAGVSSDSGVDAGSCERWAEGLSSCDGLNVSCDQREAIAGAWLARFTDCIDDSDCQIVTLGCPSPFLCGAAISSDADIDAIEATLDRLRDQHAEHQCGCAIADCGPVVATCSNRKCTAVSDPL